MLNQEDRELAIVTRGLTRVFGELTAVDGLDLQVPKGSLFGFLGPNGAGKTTTLRCLVGLLQPTSGTVHVLGLDVVRNPLEVRRTIGALLEEPCLFEYLTAIESLSFVGRVHGLTTAVIERRALDLLEILDLKDAAHRLVTDLSHGTRKRLGLAVALLPSPRLLFLDEPFEGLDPIGATRVKDLLRAYVRRGATVFLTSHILEIVERLADHVAIINKGRLVSQGPLDAILSGRGGAGELEQAFLTLVGKQEMAGPELEWLP